MIVCSVCVCRMLSLGSFSTSVIQMNPYDLNHFLVGTDLVAILIVIEMLAFGRGFEQLDNIIGSYLFLYLAAL